MYFYCYVRFFVSVLILIVMYVLFWLFPFIVLFCVLFVSKYVQYYFHRVSTQLHLINIPYHIISYHTVTNGSGDHPAYHSTDTSLFPGGKAAPSRAHPYVFMV